jgi:hypothetical protein
MSDNVMHRYEPSYRCQPQSARRFMQPSRLLLPSCLEQQQPQQQQFQWLPARQWLSMVVTSRSRSHDACAPQHY